MKRWKYERPMAAELLKNIRRHPDLLHVLVGARQTGKTTVSEQVEKRWEGATVRDTADLSMQPGPEWIEQHWSKARRESGPRRRSVLLILDEIQKARRWSETVKRMWDEDRRRRTPIRVLLLGSSSLLVQKGLTESLAGRFFLHRSPHWSFSECRAAFQWNLERWIFFGGYPRAASFLPDENAWRQYVADALIETAIARDVLQMQTVAKPALLRHLFGLSCQYPAHILSYNKMLGTLQDAGNTVTLAHYLRLLEAAFLVSGLDCVSGRKRVRASSPKFVHWNNALVTALSGISFREARANASYWGRLVENAVGAHLLNALPKPRYAVGYWREGNNEMDFVVTAGVKHIGIEVKSGAPGKMSGVDAFRRRFPAARIVIIGTGGLDIQDFFESYPPDILGV